MDELIRKPADQQDPGSCEVAVRQNGAATGENVAVSKAPAGTACTVSELKVNSQRNCFRLGTEAMSMLQQTGVSVSLETGTHLIQLRNSHLNHQEVGQSREPLMMLWIYSGRVINQKTGVAVEATWSTLNGWDDTLTLEVLEPATLCAFFLDTEGNAAHADQNLSSHQRAVELAIVRI